MEKVGLGLRFSFMEDVLNGSQKPDWFEIAPENWMSRGGKMFDILEKIRADIPIVCHGLSLSIGSPDDLDFIFLKELKQFLDYFEIDVYSEHLSFSSLDNGYLYDLFPVPFTEDRVKHISKKIKIVQDVLERKLILENISYYFKFDGEMEEVDFINQVLEEGNCELLLDINNVYVNSMNHNYDPVEFIKNINKEKVAYYHIAGHEKFDDLLIDTHGAQVNSQVFNLLEIALEEIGEKPTLLERDNNIPPYEQLFEEYEKLKEFVENAKVY